MNTKYSRESFVINEDLCLALVDKRITCDMELELKKRNIQIIKTTECKECYNAIKYHPDISICNLGEGNIVVAPNVYEYYFNILKKLGFNILKGDSYIKRDYPHNIQYNVAIFGNYAIHNFEHTDKKILDYINKKKLTKINIKQGYSKCSICIVDENSIITSDVGIYKTVLKYGIDCLLIQSKNIDLFELNYGFIGGCSGLISKDKLAFFGDITKHPDYENIKKFLKSKNKEIVNLSKERLLDLGSIIPLMTRKE
ncbi:Uncharacterised protein [uncultured Clostridium sp.]|uniref:DUF6873 family GME fold protein n=1 Tax=Paeniclostridium hominis TaxID=2764329 RepID=UPI0008232B95|nr:MULTISPECIES: hypothetical protein [Paeniclostridium]MBC8631376.1 hypothetical protein [[Eubacterium] tenue]MDU1539914.1 hypothetical protein [Paeniclostridium sordellii]SCJ32131.1 Uncharacterised protein [uncultured Clostridium sp.]SCJ33580.1 Uncharacterised protein [uncultured Clostridium sp.]